MQPQETETGKANIPSCAHCGSELIVRPAWLCWNVQSQDWEVEHSSERGHCQSCERATELKWSQKLEGLPGKRLRELNDLFRKNGFGRGSILITQGVQAFGDEAVLQIMDIVRRFEDFEPESDPWGEHDFGAFTYKNEKLYWKIDYYDLTKSAGSPNPANSGVTHRVITIMLAQEY